MKADISGWKKWEGKGDPPDDPKVAEGCLIYSVEGAEVLGAEKPQGTLAFYMKTLKHTHVKQGGLFAGTTQQRGGLAALGADDAPSQCGAYDPDGGLIFRQNFPGLKTGLGGSVFAGTTELLGPQQENMGRITGKGSLAFWEKQGTCYTAVPYQEEKTVIWLYKGKHEAPPGPDVGHAAQLRVTGFLSGVGLAEFGIPPFEALISPGSLQDMEKPEVALFCLIYGIQSGRKFHAHIPAAVESAAGGR